ncbi:MAG TPA: DUF169 domain-containing protein, partial [Spirochaetota bacterium]|nr:DUF169 domain-containing protein [Spirochaetota bacterium]
SVTSCQAEKQSALGDEILLTRNNIGCIAAGITFGLIDQNEREFLQGSRIYTDIMKNQSGKDEKFIPPSPKDFTEGIVYACKDAGKDDFCLFGREDTGRFKTVEIAKKAVSEMMAIQPAKTEAVFFYSMDFDDIEITPDVVILSVRPVELTRIIQGYQFLTGERVVANMGPVRVVNSDLIVRPYLTQKINFSSYCVGARLIAKYDANRLGIGFPYKLFEETVSGIVQSKTGYPFHLYPGAEE